jgi:hypothetical protein
VLELRSPDTMLTPVMVAAERPAAQDAEAWCERCGCRLSRYRPAGRATCWQCGGADTSSVSGMGHVAAGTCEPRIRELLATRGALTAAEIAELAGISRPSVKTARSPGCSAAGRPDATVTYKRPRYTLEAGC